MLCIKFSFYLIKGDKEPSYIQKAFFRNIQISPIDTKIFS